MARWGEWAPGRCRAGRIAPAAAVWAVGHGAVLGGGLSVPLGEPI